MVMGHEVAGHIDELGPDQSKNMDFKKGDRVAVFPWLGCQKCQTCKAGETNLCDNDPILLSDYG